MDCFRSTIESRSSDQKRRGSVVDGEDVFFDVDDCDPNESRLSNAAGNFRVQDVGTNVKRITEICE